MASFNKIIRINARLHLSALELKQLSKYGCGAIKGTMLWTKQRTALLWTLGECLMTN